MLCQMHEVDLIENAISREIWWPSLSLKREYDVCDGHIPSSGLFPLEKALDGPGIFARSHGLLDFPGRVTLPDSDCSGPMVCLRILGGVGYSRQHFAGKAGARPNIEGEKWFDSH